MLHPTSLIRHPTNTKGEWAKLKRIPGLLRRYQEGVETRNRYQGRTDKKQRSTQEAASQETEGSYGFAHAPGSRKAANQPGPAGTSVDSGEGDGDELRLQDFEAGDTAGERIELARDEIAAHRIEAERLLNVAHAKSQVTKFQLDGQPQPIIARVVDHVSELLAVDETIEYIAVQAKQPPEMPDCLVLTTNRLIIVRHQILGQLDHEEYRWEQLYEPRMKDGQPHAEFSLRALSGQVIVVDHLPRLQVKQSVRVAKEREEELRKRRLRREREARAAEDRIGESPEALAADEATSTAQPAPKRFDLNGSLRGNPSRTPVNPTGAATTPQRPASTQTTSTPPASTLSASTPSASNPTSPAPTAPAQPTITYSALPPHLQAKWKAVDELFEIGVISQEEMEEERRNLLQTALKNRKR